jgi:cytochrome oxidase assembly protein ShyY1
VYRFLLSRQWVILTLVALLLIPTMVWLGFWQLHRHEQRVARNELIATSLDAPAVPMAELTEAGGAVDPDDRYRPVTATGVYDAGGEVLARQRANVDGALGYYVLTPLIQEDGTGVLVNRGWVPGGNDPTRAPRVTDPPRGEVTVTGRLMRDETSGNTGIRERSGLPRGMVMLISSEERAAALDTPMLGGYLELARTTPGGGDGPGGGGARPELLPEPDHSSIGVHFAYAIQWWLFTAGVPVGWVLLVRREIRDRRTADAGQPPAEPPAREPEVTGVGAN